MHCVKSLRAPNIHDPMFSLGVDTTGGKTISLYELEAQTTIDEVKAKIEDSMGILSGRQKLLARGQEVRGGSLEDNKIDSYTRVILIDRDQPTGIVAGLPRPSPPVGWE